MSHSTFDRILELSAPIPPDDNEDSDTIEKNDPTTADDGTFPLRFQERSLREYFQAMSTDNDGLRTSPSSAHLTIFENIASVLSGTSKVSEKLGDYAVKFWLSHFQSIDPSLHTEEKDVIRVFQSLALIFNNAIEATKLIEKHGILYSYFGDYTNGVLEAWFFVRVREWLEKLPSDLSVLDEATRSWAEAAKTSPLKIVATFVKGHVSCWFHAIPVNGMTRSAGFAIYALSYVRINYSNLYMYILMQDHENRQISILL